MQGTTLELASTLHSLSKLRTLPAAYLPSLEFVRDLIPWIASSRILCSYILDREEVREGELLKEVKYSPFHTPYPSQPKFDLTLVGLYRLLKEHNIFTLQSVKSSAFGEDGEIFLGGIPELVSSIKLSDESASHCWTKTMSIVSSSDLQLEDLQQLAILNNPRASKILYLTEPTFLKLSKQIAENPPLLRQLSSQRVSFVPTDTGKLQEVSRLINQGPQTFFMDGGPTFFNSLLRSAEGANDIEIPVDTLILTERLTRHVQLEAKNYIGQSILHSDLHKHFTSVLKIPVRSPEGDADDYQLEVFIRTSDSAARRKAAFFAKEECSRLFN